MRQFSCISVYRIAVSFLIASGLAGCGISSTPSIYTPAGGDNTYVPDDSLSVYSPSSSAGGDGWADGYYNMGYPGVPCFGIACFCPPGMSAGTFKASMLLTEATAADALSSVGKSRLTTENEIRVNSSNVASVNASSNSKITAPDFFLVGNYTGPLYGTVHLGQTKLNDPLQYLPTPSKSGLTVRHNGGVGVPLVVSTPTTLLPGVYNGGITISGADVTLGAGLYYIENGGFTAGSGAEVIGIETTIYLADAAGATMSINGGASAQLTPPLEGLLMGLTLFFNRSLAATVTITGGGNLQIYGSLYMPSATVNLGGNGTMVAGSQIVADSVSVGGNGQSVITTANGLYTLPSGCF